MRLAEIAVTDNITSLLTYYDKLRVYKSASDNGTFTLAGSVNLAANTYLYTYVDNDGSATDWYKFSYYKSTLPTAESSQMSLPVYYCPVSILKSRLNETGTSDDLNFIDAVAAATDEVRRYCRRDFFQKTETRYFEGSGPRPVHTGKSPDILWLDDCVSLSSIVVDYSSGASPSNVTTYTLNTHCYLWPQTATNFYDPYEGLVWIASINLPQNMDFPLYSNLYWPKGYQAIRLTGVWGYPVNPYTNSPVPAAVKEATLQVAARIYKGRDNAYSRVIGNADYGTLQIKDDLFNADTRALLRPYVKQIGK